MFDFALFLKDFVEFSVTFWHYYQRSWELYNVSTAWTILWSAPNAIFATLTGMTGYKVKVQAQPIEVTKQQVRQALESAYGEFQAEIVNLLLPDWASNPLYVGAYSNSKLTLPSSPTWTWKFPLTASVSMVRPQWTLLCTRPWCLLCWNWYSKCYTQCPWCHQCCTSSFIQCQYPCCAGCSDVVVCMS